MSDAEDGGVDIKTELHNGEGSDTDSENDVPAVEITPTEISTENLDDVMKELSTKSPLLYEYLKIARSSEFCKNLRLILSSNNSGIFLSITNNHPDLYLLFRNNINLIVRSTGPDLFCTLYTYKHQVFKGMVIKDFDKYLTDQATKAGIIMFLKELEKDRYRVCSGAFTENELLVGLNNEMIRSLLIEKFEGSVVYRSRDCFTLVPTCPGETLGCGTSSCECCLKLKLELASNLSAEEKAKMFEGCGDNDNTETALSNFVEVCMDSDNEDENPDDPREDSLNISQENSDNYDRDKENREEEVEGREKEEEEEEDMDRSFPSFTRYTQRKVKTTKVSYKKLIISAILSSPNNMMKLTEIYDWILERYPLFNENKTGFQNSIRHNLSLNRIFVKVPLGPEFSTTPGPPGSNKGSYWTIEPSELKIQKDWTLTDSDQSFIKKLQGKDANYKIRLPKLAPRAQSAEKKDLNISSRFVAIAPKPSADSVFVLDSRQSEQKADDDPETGALVIDEKSDSLKELPANLKEQLKTGLPIILRPVDNPTSSLPIIIQPSSVISLSPVIPPPSSSVGQLKMVSGNITLLQRPQQAPQQATKTYSKSVLKTTTTTTDSTGVKLSQLPVAANLGTSLSNTFTSAEDTETVQGSASVGSNEFPKPPFSYKELCMISIFYAPTKQMSLGNIYDHVKLWFPYYRQTSIGLTWQNSIRHNLSLNKVFRRVETENQVGGRWTFSTEDETWKKLIVSNKWFETPVDADLFEHMAKNCPEFQQKVYSKKNMFKTVPITVKSDDTTTKPDPDEAPLAKRLKMEEVDEVEEMEEVSVKREQEDNGEDIEDDLEDEDEEDPLASS